MNHSLKLLIVEDDAGDARSVGDALSGCRVPASIARACTLEEGAALVEQGFDAILLDLDLPDSSGITTVVSMRDLAPRVPIVVFTRLNGEATGLEAVRLGAQDYLVKGQADGALIVRTIRHAIERKHGDDRLIAMSEALHAANRSLDEFVRVASQDLRGPLARIVELSSILASEARAPMDPEDRRWLQEEIGRSACRMQRLIDALLSYARAVRRTPAMEPVPLRRIVDEVLDDLACRVRDCGAMIDVSSLPVVMADPVQIRQVLQNMIENALTFSAAADRTPRVAISASERGGITRVSVSDNGVGFTQAESERLFTPFGQVGALREGSGLGLAICRRIVEAHGGHVSATARPNEGATFTFTVPSALAPAPLTAHP